MNTVVCLAIAVCSFVIIISSSSSVAESQTQRPHDNFPIPSSTVGALCTSEGGCLRRAREARVMLSCWCMCSSACLCLCFLSYQWLIMWTVVLFANLLVLLFACFSVASLPLCWVVKVCIWVSLYVCVLVSHLCMCVHQAMFLITKLSYNMRSFNSIMLAKLNFVWKCMNATKTPSQILWIYVFQQILWYGDLILTESTYDLTQN